MPGNQISLGAAFESMEAIRSSSTMQLKRTTFSVKQTGPEKSNLQPHLLAKASLLLEYLNIW